MCSSDPDIDFQKAVREVYLGQCEVDPDFIRIDCSDSEGNMLPPDMIATEVRTEIDKNWK